MQTRGGTVASCLVLDGDTWALQIALKPLLLGVTGEQAHSTQGKWEALGWKCCGFLRYGQGWEGKMQKGQPPALLCPFHKRSWSAPVPGPEHLSGKGCCCCQQGITHTD